MSVSFFLILGCSKDNENDLDNTKLFDYKNLNALNIADIDNIWSEGKKIDTSFYMRADFENKWWYSDYMDYVIFDNQYNTIVEIDFSSNATFDLTKDILLDVASEINDRIEKLSD